MEYPVFNRTQSGGGVGGAVLTIELPNKRGFSGASYDMTEYLSNWKDLTVYNFGIVTAAMSGGDAGTATDRYVAKGTGSCTFRINAYDAETGELRIHFDLANGSGGQTDVNRRTNRFSVAVYGGIAV